MVYAALHSEVKQWNDWVSGQVYGYVVRDSKGNSIDSCWGFYGSDHEESGLEEAYKGFIDWKVKDDLVKAEKELFDWFGF